MHHVSFWVMSMKRNILDDIVVCFKKVCKLKKIATQEKNFSNKIFELKKNQQLTRVYTV